jgi:hypothetical protein
MMYIRITFLGLDSVVNGQKVALLCFENFSRNNSPNYHKSLEIGSHLPIVGPWIFASCSVYVQVPLGKPTLPCMPTAVGSVRQSKEASDCKIPLFIDANSASVQIFTTLILQHFRHTTISHSIGRRWTLREPSQATMQTNTSGCRQQNRGHQWVDHASICPPTYWFQMELKKAIYSRWSQISIALKDLLQRIVMYILRKSL